MDLDLFDTEDDAPKNVRAGPRFQPKAKLHPPKKATLVVPSSQQVSMNEQSGGVNDSSECGANSVVDSDPERLTKENVRAGPRFQPKAKLHPPKRATPVVPSSEQVSTNEQSEVVDDSSERGANSVDDSCPERSTKENTDIMIELESLTGILDDTPVSNVPDDPIIIQPVLDDLSCFSHIPDVSIAEDPLTENEFIVVEPVPNRDEHVQTTGPGKLASRRRAKSTKDDQSSNLHEEGTTNSRVLRKRQNRENLFGLVDELEEEDNHARVDNDDDSEIQPNKSPGEKEKPKRKRKKDDKKTDETAKEEPPKKKKFTRSTKRRKVDKSLLENPDNIDHRNVSLTNLIRLAEYKERATKKLDGTASSSSQAAAAAPPPNLSGFQEYNEGDDIAFDEAAGYFDGEPIMAEENLGFFNYHTFMNKTSRSKWTDQDTELFYEGIQQFGTDFTMIQQLFPGRTRRQVKLKYKKEELKYPIRVREALMNRAKGHSHFDTVIERLKEIAEEEKKNNKNDDDDDNDDDLVNVEDEDIDEQELEPEPEPKNRDKEEDGSARIDHDQDVLNKEEDGEANVTEQAYDSEDELFQWSEYKSDL